MSNEIILFAEYEKLRSEVELLRTELSMLVLERDELRYVECPNIEMAYTLAFGSLEYSVFEAECRYLRLKRKIDLIQTRKNRQESVDLVAIEEALDEEFAAFQAKLDEQIGRVNAALDRSRSDVLSPDETAELKKLYRHVVKALHPDLHPDIGEEKVALFSRAVTAYENGDLDALRVIDAMIAGEPLPDAREDAMQTLVKDRERLKKLLESVQTAILSIKSEYPYVLKEYLTDGEKAAAHKRRLKKMLTEYEQAIAACKARIQEMIG